MNLFDLTDKVAVVTGGAGYLGSAMSIALAEYGATVIAIGRDENKLRTLVDKHTRILGRVCDLTDEDAVVSLFKEFPKVDILVNNVFQRFYKDPLHMTLDEWNQGLDNVLTSYFLCTREVAPKMLEQKKGSIINIASIYASLGTDSRIFHEPAVPVPLTYAVGKGGVLQMTRHLAALWAKNGIRVNTISPTHNPKESNTPNLAYMMELRYRTPMGRTGEPNDLQGAIVYLASDSSSFMTGQNLIIDGGWNVW